MKKIALFTSIHARHISFIEQIKSVYVPSLIVLEKKKANSFAKAEDSFFQNKLKLKNINFCKTILVEKGDINSRKVHDAILENNIDIVLVFGTSIIKNYILSAPNNFAVNIHTGLVQAFRGVDSCFWAIHDEKPEGIGVTIHKINKGIDTGNILLQSRPKLDHSDNIDTIFFKNCQAGFDLMKKNINCIIKNTISEKPLKNRGKLYMIKDMNNEAIVKVKNKTKSVIKKYLDNKSHIDKKIKIISEV